MGKKEDLDDEMYVQLDLEGGTVDCSIVAIFECNGKDYIALLPLDEDGETKTAKCGSTVMKRMPRATPLCVISMTKRNMKPHPMLLTNT